MSDQPAGTEDVQGHMHGRPRADSNQEQSEDVAGHRYRPGIEAERDESVDDQRDDSEDVEGHGKRGDGVVDPERDESKDVQDRMQTRPRADSNQEQPEDVEGHGKRSNGVVDPERDESKDVEGHMPLRRAVLDEEQSEDVEGHGHARISDDQQANSRRRGTGGGASEDVEGNRLR
jgi:hypothetical protein